MAPERPSIFTAIVFHNGEEDYDNTSMVLTAPLLHYDDAIPMGNHEEEDESEHKFFNKRIRLGFSICLLTQVVSLGAYATIIRVHWGDKNVVHKTEDDWFLYNIFSTLTQIHICVYAVVWVAFACAMIRGAGMAMFRDQFQTPVKRRFFFVSDGLYYFLVGFVVIGALFMIDLYLGFPIPYLLSVATFIADLVVCHMMIWG
jgi:hypothetical protein